MNLFPLVGVSLGIIIGYLIVRMVAIRMGKPLPSLGEIMYPLHHTDSKRNQANRRRGKR